MADRILRLVPARELPYTCTLPAPHGRVRLEVRGYTECLVFRYQGRAADLIACGVVSKELTLPQRTNRRILDEEGDQIRRQLPQRPGGGMWVTRTKPRERAGQLPGFESWMLIAPTQWPRENGIPEAARIELLAAVDQSEQELIAKVAALRIAPKAPSSRLRLVVDNTGVQR